MNAPSTLLLTQRDIEKTLTRRDYIEAVEAAFLGLSNGDWQVPEVVHMPAGGGAFHVKSAARSSEPKYVAVKVNGNFPDNPSSNGLPTIQGVIVLCDGNDGRLLAVIDSIEVTAMRTGAASAVAAKYLSNPRARSMAVIGCGIQGLAQLRFALEVRSPATVRLYDKDTNKAVSLADTLQKEDPDRAYEVAGSAAAASRTSDIVLTCTTARSPILGIGDVRRGAFVAAAGADDSGKQELSGELLASCTVVCDLIDQCRQIGDLHHAIAGGAMSAADVAAELGDIVSGRVPYAYSPEKTVVFDSTGSAIQDAAAAGMIYERAKAGGIGAKVEFA